MRHRLWIRQAPSVSVSLGVIGLPFFAVTYIISSIPAAVGGTIMIAKKSEEKWLSWVSFS